MKKSFLSTGFVLAGQFLAVGNSFARNNSAEQAEAMLGRINREKAAPAASAWVSTGPTAEDIKAATEVKNQAVQGSREAKLLDAVKKGDLKNVQTSIAAGAHLEARDNENMTPLMIAARKGYADIARKLVEAGADVNARGRYSDTVLFYAADSDNAEIVRLLITRGAAQGDNDCTSYFMAAVFKGNNQMVEAFMLDDTCIDPDYLTAAYFTARRTCSPEIVEAIRKLHNKSRS